MTRAMGRLAAALLSTLSSTLAFAAPDEPEPALATRPTDDAAIMPRNPILMLDVVATYCSFSGDPVIAHRNNEFTVIPDIRGGAGFETGLGFQFVRIPSHFGWWLTLGYAHTWLKPDAPFPEGNVDATAILHTLRIEHRASYQVSSQISPFVLLATDVLFLNLAGTHGFVVSGEVIPDAHTTELQGFSLGIGVGVMIHATDALALEIAGSYRAFAFSSLDGAKLADSWHAQSWMLQLGPALVL